MTERIWKRACDVSISTLLLSLFAYAVATELRGSPSMFWAQVLGVVGVTAMLVFAVLVLLYPGDIHGTVEPMSEAEESAPVTASAA